MGNLINIHSNSKHLHYELEEELAQLTGDNNSEGIFDVSNDVSNDENKGQHLSQFL